MRHETPFLAVWTLLLVLASPAAARPADLAEVVAPNSGHARSRGAVKLNGPLEVHGDVVEFQVSADGQWAVYLADPEVDGLFELFSVPAAGGEATLLFTPLTQWSKIQEFQLSGDSTRVVFRHGPLGAGKYDLFSVPIEGGTPVRLNDDETSAVSPSFAISPDGAAVVFYGWRGVDFDPHCRRYFSVAVTGGPIRARGGCPYVGDPYASEFFRISDDSQRLVYTQPNHSYVDANLTSWPLAAGTPVLLDGVVRSDDFVISPDSQEVAYTTGLAAESGRFMIVPISGGQELELDPRRGWDPAFSPVPVDGSSRLVYFVGGNSKLFSVATNGGAPVELTPTPLYYPSDAVFEITADGTRVVYQGRYDAVTDELFSVETLGGTPIQLNDGGSLRNFSLSPDGATAVYSANQDQPAKYELYAVPVGGGISRRLNGDLYPGPGKEVWPDYAIAPDGLTVVYRASQDYPGSVQIYEAQLAGGETVRLNGELVSGGNCLEFQVGGDGQRVFYLANAETTHQVELFSVLRNQPVNTPPTADAGQDAQAECLSGAGLVTLDGSGSSDPDSTPETHDDIELFEWFLGYGSSAEELLGTGKTLNVSLALGEHGVTLRVTDRAGESGTDDLLASVVDTTAPVVSCSASTDTLWPPNHGMIDVGWSPQAVDACDEAAPSLLVAVGSDEDPAAASGAGGPEHCPDAEIGLEGTLLLRAERSGGGDGRIYEIHLTATDVSGNASSCSVNVGVPRSRGRGGDALDSGQAFDATSCGNVMPPGPQDAAPMERAPDAAGTRTPNKHGRRSPG